eukprot:comp23744_c1_seq2/m.40991 comp23744_c1_seq2/g.40991  ORF comp23744_c1_seq2/g.40991 comp23744_c1_seq2/m.40991 type:complete len:472 (-) comp23744_c1_seq2:501-1916(-)
MADAAGQKRGNDEAQNGQGAKRARVEGPSAVLHCRNVPADCTEMELLQLGQPFGRVVNVLMLKGKTQAFIELESAEAATNMLNVYTATPPMIRKRAIYFSYSQHQHLTNPSLSLEGNTAGTILLVKIHNQLYPVTLDVLCQVFSKFGTILKMVTFTKSDGVFQCLVQFADASSAKQARTMLDGQNLYARCCTLKIEPSKLTTLTVKYNNEKSWDFTNPNLPTGDGASGAGGMGMGMPQHMNTSNGQIGVGMGGPAMGMGVSHGPAVLLLNNLPVNDKLTCDMLFTLVGLYADVDRVKILFNKQDSALVQLRDANHAQTAMQHLNGVKLFGLDMNVMLSKHNEVKMAGKNDQKEEGARELTKDYTNSPLHRFRNPGSKNFNNIAPPCPTLHVSNIPATIDEAYITSLFSPYGTVTGCRFFSGKNESVGNNERRMALVRYSSTEEAVMGLIKVHNYPVADKTHLRVSFSKADF